MGLQCSRHNLVEPQRVLWLEASAELIRQNLVPQACGSHHGPHMQLPPVADPPAHPWCYASATVAASLKGHESKQGRAATDPFQSQSAAPQ